MFKQLVQVHSSPQLHSSPYLHGHQEDNKEMGYKIAKDSLEGKALVRDSQGGNRYHL